MKRLFLSAKCLIVPFLGSAFNRRCAGLTQFPRSGVWLPLLAMGSLSACDISQSSEEPSGQNPDPVVVDYPIAFIERALPIDTASNQVALTNLLDPCAFFPGARLILKERARSSAPEVELTQRLFPDGLGPNETDEDAEPGSLIDIKDLQTSPDGTQLIFALRAPARDADADSCDPEEPDWDIWLYDRPTDSLSPLLPANEAAKGQDVSPAFLPDGRIVFASTRQRRGKAILVDEGKPQFSALDEDLQLAAFNLHAYDPETQSITQLTFNPSHDLQPQVLPDGRILFIRWDNINAKNHLSLYSIRADGSELQLIYGYPNNASTNNASTNNSLSLGRFAAQPSGEIIAQWRQRESRQWGGDMVRIDWAGFTQAQTPHPINPGSGSGQTSISPAPIDLNGTAGTLSPGGYFNSAYPLNDGTDRLLISWSPCQIRTAAGELKPCQNTSVTGAEIPSPQYGLWIFNPRENTQLPLKIPRNDKVFIEPVVLAPQAPADDSRTSLDPVLARQGLAELHIHSVDSLDGRRQASPNTPRFLRLVKSVAIPDADTRDFDRAAFGLGRSQLMRDILGYVPIQPDGSVKFRAPAEVPFMIEVVDSQGRRLSPRHENWLVLQPGEKRECAGCHDASADNSRVHGRLDAEPTTPPLEPPFSGQLLGEDGQTLSAPLLGQTLAEHFFAALETANPFAAALQPSVDMVLTDIWTPADQATVELRYSAIADAIGPLPPSPPLGASSCPLPFPLEPNWHSPASCSSGLSNSPYAPSAWSPLCRTSIHYPVHLQPLFERDRRACDDQGLLIKDDSCISCHSAQLTNDQNLPIAPSGSLILTQEAPPFIIDNPEGLATVGCNFTASQDYVGSYEQLLRARPRYRLSEDGSALVMETITEPVIENGQAAVDENGEPVYQLRCLTQSATSSATFAALFGAGGSHQGRLSASELRLILEWFDVGMQYYNNPFEAPLN